MTLTAVFGWLLVLVPLAAILGGLLWREILQRRQLEAWLRDPEARAIPDGSGPWCTVFSALQRLRKNEARCQIDLAASLDRFRLAAQALPDGVVLLDGGGRIEWMNKSAARQLGLDPGRDLGTLLEHLIRRNEFHEYLAEFVARGRRAGAVPSQPLVLTFNGDYPKRVLSLLLLSFADAGTLLLSRDITEIARTETMRRDFIANVSHELRTPLTVVFGFLEQIPPESAPPFLPLLLEQTQRMNRLVEDLLVLSRLESDTEPPRAEVVDVSALLTSLLDEGRALSKGRHLLELGEVSRVRLRGSPEELRSAFGNLVSNAVRYTPAGGTVTLRWTFADGYSTFAVADTGIGIPAEHIPRLTERFYRVDKGRSSASGGTGLGLAIVKHVLARHQGRLEIRSEPGRGSEFAALFPPERAVLQA